MSKEVKKGAKVKLLVGAKDSRGSEFTVLKRDGDRIFLEGYRVLKRTKKLSPQNSENHASVHHSVHVSNVAKVD